MSNILYLLVIADRVVGEFDSKSRALSAAQNASERDEGGEYRVYELVGTWMTGEKGDV